jgi:hypothetical protein
MIRWLSPAAAFFLAGAADPACAADPAVTLFKPAAWPCIPETSP